MKNYTKVDDATLTSVTPSEIAVGPLADFADVDEDSFHGSEARRAFKSFTYGNSPILGRKVKKAFTPILGLKKTPLVDEMEIRFQYNDEKITESNEEDTSIQICYAPPGKLGVAIDSVNGVPVVHKVKPGSPLEGVLTHLDRIVAIDDVDTTNMSAAEITRLMVRNMNKSRKILFVREAKVSSML